MSTSELVVNFTPGDSFFGNTWNFSQNGHKRWNEDFDIRFYNSGSQTQEAQQGHPIDHPGNQAAFAWVGEARCGRSGMFGGMSEFITCHIEQWTHVSPNRPQGGIWSKECLWFSKFARFFLPNFCEGFVPVIQCIVESFPKCHTFFTIPGPCL